MTINTTSIAVSTALNVFGGLAVGCAGRIVGCSVAGSEAEGVLSLCVGPKVGEGAGVYVAGALKLELMCPQGAS